MVPGSLVEREELRCIDVAYPCGIVAYGLSMDFGGGDKIPVVTGVVVFGACCWADSGDHVGCCHGFDPAWMLEAASEGICGRALFRLEPAGVCGVASGGCVLPSLSHETALSVCRRGIVRRRLAG
jgi:hypothetical protein